MITSLLYWLQTRALAICAATATTFGLAAHGPARVGGAALALAAGAIGIIMMRRRRHQPAGDAEGLGTRSGLLLSSADCMVLLAAAWLLPSLDRSGLGGFYAVYPGAPVLRAAAVLTVAAIWIRVARARTQPRTASEFLHPVIVMAGALTAWFLVDRVLPRGWGPEQAVFAVALAAVWLAYLALVNKMIGSRSGSPGESGPTRVSPHAG